MKGNIFDVKRFAIHDGQGIRTTIFFKGCLLRCVWCQNPEGLEGDAQVLYMEKTCIHCGICVKESKAHGIELKHGNLQIFRDRKEDWRHLADSCPSGALCLDTKEYTSDALVEEALKDKMFFRYGGGVTISGGEPFYQSDFLMEVLRKLKEKGIHTTIETSLFVKREILEKALPYIDHIYVDIKLFDAEKHKQYTGVDNHIILDNVAWLLHSDRKKDVTIRTPLIPGMSATEENITAISKFITSNYKDAAYELLNYNPLAKAKYALTGKQYCFKENPELYTSKQMEEFYTMAKNGGITNLIIV